MQSSWRVWWAPAKAPVPWKKAPPSAHVAPPGGWRYTALGRAVKLSSAVVLPPSTAGSAHICGPKEAKRRVTNPSTAIKYTSLPQRRMCLFSTFSFAVILGTVLTDSPSQQSGQTLSFPCCYLCGSLLHVLWFHSSVLQAGKIKVSTVWSACWASHSPLPLCLNFLPANNIPLRLLLSIQGHCQGGEREVIQTDSILLDHSQIAASEGLLCSDDLLYHRVRDWE